ncbi:MAG: HD-GYP domain-containing protein [Acidiferrobacterales bacterium]
MKKRVAVRDLRPGMYVAELDRPWLETPFLFQGFELSSPQEIDQLREHCQYVYIDAELGDDLVPVKGRKELPHRTQALRVAEEKLKQEFKVLLESPERNQGRLPYGDRKPYRDQLPLEEELERAIQLESEAWGMVREALVGVREGKPVDAKAAESLVREMVESVVRNPDALLDVSCQHESRFASDQGVPMEEEIGRARKIESDAKNVIGETLKDVRQGKAVDSELAKKVVDRLVSSVERNPDSLVLLNQQKQTETYMCLHAIRACTLVLIFGRHLSLSRAQLTILGLGALMHDVGMVKVPDAILNKPIGLSEAEFEIMEGHVAAGVEILKGSDGFPHESIQIVEQHHERHDGSGYPKKINGDLIGLSGSIGAIVDVYDAITSQRIYRGGISAEDALKRMYEWRRKDFQPELVEEFIRCMGIFPIGSLVELNTGGIGVVITINRERRLKPKVALVLRSNKEPYTKRFIADLVKHRTRTGGELRIKRVLPSGAFGINPVDHIAKL